MYPGGMVNIHAAVWFQTHIDLEPRSTLRSFTQSKYACNHASLLAPNPTSTIPCLHTPTNPNTSYHKEWSHFSPNRVQFMHIFLACASCALRKCMSSSWLTLSRPLASMPRSAPAVPNRRSCCITCKGSWCVRVYVGIGQGFVHVHGRHGACICTFKPTVLVLVCTQYISKAQQRWAHAHAHAQHHWEDKPRGHWVHAS